MKYPIGIQSFDKVIKEGYVYVDKTALLYSLVKEGTIYFLSRPRRFGKSLLVSTIENYFLGRKELFKGLKIDGLEKDWLEYPVFHIDFSGDNFVSGGLLENKIERYLMTWEETYGSHPAWKSMSDRFAYVLQQARKCYGRRCVVLVDEYDKPILDTLDSEIEVVVDGQKMLLEDRNRDLLRRLYSVFKAADDDLQFVLLTGVTKFSQVSVFSGFNQPKDISMDRRYEAICGITQEELESYFVEPIASMAIEWEKSVEEMKVLLKRQYDGYHFSKRLTDVYNPFSLLSAFDQQDIGDYWFSTGTPTYLLRLLSHANENLDDLTGHYYQRQEFVDYKATVEKPLPMIYQSGYLTIKEYNREDDMFLLDYPNDEVKKGFLTMVAADYMKTKESVGTFVLRLSKTLKNGDLDGFHKMLASFLASIPYSMRRKSDERERERYFHYTFYLLLRLMSLYTIYTEKEQSQGRVDCIVETDKYVYIFEFKLDGTAEEALKQIEDKGYARPYEMDKRKLYKIGVSFSSETGTIEDWRVG